MIRIQSYALSLMIVILFTGCGSGSTVTSTNSGTGGSGSGSSIISGVLPLGPATQFNTNRTSFTFNTSTGSMSVQSTGVPFHPTGPFTINPVQNQNFNQSFPLRGGLNEPNLNPSSTPLGPIGIAINGVVFFNPSAGNGIPAGGLAPPPPGYNYNAGNEAAYFGEDYAGGHAQQTGQYHYHAPTFYSAWLRPSSESQQISYLDGSLTHPNGHSKIVGYAFDGYPIYGPYGYAQPMNASSGVVRMVSGYVVKSTSRSGAAALAPYNNATLYPMGIFIQDYEYTSTALGRTLDAYNGRYGVTPDYPNGTYAYFQTIDAQGKQAFPYTIGIQYYGQPAPLPGLEYCPFGACRCAPTLREKRKLSDAWGRPRNETPAYIPSSLSMRFQH